MAKQENAYRRSTCRACHSENLSIAIPFPSTPVGDSYCSSKEAACQEESFPLDLMVCRECGLLQLTTVVSPAKLYGNFTYETAVSKGLSEHFEAYAREIVTLTQVQPGQLVVDIGSNDGTLLGKFKALGLNVLGVDPAATIAQRASEKGIPTLASMFNSSVAAQIVNSVGAPALIVSNNTFANIDEPLDFLLAAKQLLASQGTLIIETGYGPDVVEKGLFDTIYHEHLSYFSLASLSKLLGRAGFTPFDAKYIPTKGGSLRVLATHSEFKRETTQTLGDMLAAEQERYAKLDHSALVLSQKLVRSASKLKELLASYRARGLTVYGYGASVGVTTFLYTFDLGSEFVGLVDDNPIKFHKYSPGFGLPVMPSNYLLKDPANSVAVILAWRYVPQIRNTHNQFLQAGGTLVVPWPELEVLQHEAKR